MSGQSHFSSQSTTAPTTEQSTPQPELSAQNLLGNAALLEQLGLGSAGVGAVVAVMPGIDWPQSWWSEEGASSPHLEWWESYAMQEDWYERKKMVFSACRSQTIEEIISALPQDVTGVEVVPYETELNEVLDLVQFYATRQAAGHGATKMAQTQADYMTRQAVAKAQKDATPEEIAQAHHDGVDEQQYIHETDTPTWSALSATEQARWEARGVVAMQMLVAHAAVRAPGLNLKSNQVLLDFEGCERLGALAYTDNEGRCYIGESAVLSIEANPSSMLSVVMHEITGHREFDDGFSFSGWLYGLSTEKMSGYTEPDEEQAAAEWHRFTYFESEIGAILRESVYWMPEAAVGTHQEYNGPWHRLDRVLQNMVDQWAPELRVPVFGGLATRFEVDPRISADAVDRYRDAVARIIGVRV